MTSRSLAPSSERLGAGELGAVLQRANREYEANIDEGAAFRRLSLRLERPRRFLRTELVLAFGLFATLLLATKIALLPRAAPSISAEVARSISVVRDPEKSGSLATRVPAASEPDARSEDVSRPSPSLGRSSAKRPARGAITETPPQPPTSPPSSAQPSPAEPALAPVDDGPDCLNLARVGSTREAEACFLRRSLGSGLGAEMALYEVARLRRDVLADGGGALEALAAYRSRFSGGSLRREADMLQLELLIEMGRTADALRESAELLTSSTTGKRAAELRLLRGHIYRQKLGDLRAAEREYALGEQADGARRVEASYYRGLCLQALGDDAEAALAYERYLEQRGQGHEGDARKRLEGLRR